MKWARCCARSIRCRIRWPGWWGRGSARQAAADVGDPAARRLHLLVLAASLLWFAFWYRDTLMAMVDIWERSDTFAHGYVIAPISAWLIWRRRHFIRGVPIASSLLGIVIGLGAGAAWLLGELASVDAVSQFAFVGMLVGLVWAVMGTAVVRTYAFPLGFLFFMVPFGEFMFPTMMAWTANFIIWAVRASGVPVYAEGYNLVIPSGRWQVVEGCSAVRYLLASIVVGSLYAYLNYRSTQKRLLLVLAQRGVGEDRLDRAGRRLGRAAGGVAEGPGAGGHDAGLGEHGLGRDVERVGDRAEHLERGLVQAPLDLAQVGVRDVAQRGELTQ